jgi:hypothetical protein
MVLGSAKNEISGLEGNRFLVENIEVFKMKDLLLDYVSTFLKASNKLR